MKYLFTVLVTAWVIYFGVMLWLHFPKDYTYSLIFGVFTIPIGFIAYLDD